jgi:site-specific recombinase XerD
LPRRRRPVARQGADGYWHVWVTVGTKANSRPDQRHISRPTQDDAEDAADELLDQVRQTGAAPKAGKKPTVRSWFETYLDTVAPRRCNPNTIDSYRSQLATWVYPTYGALRLERFTPEHLDAIYVAMDRAGKAASSQLKLHSVLRRGLKIAHRRGLVARNVADLVDSPTVDEGKLVALAEAYTDRVLEVTSRRRNGTRWSVAFALGLRQGEAIGLRWEVDGQTVVDLDAGVLHVWWQLVRRRWKHGCGATTCGRRRGADCPSRHGGGLMWVKTKGKSRRSIPVPPQLLPAFKAHRAAQRRERLAYPGGWPEHGAVFTEPDGRVLDPREDYDEWVSILREAGVPHRKLHIMRHTAATMLLAQGVDISVVQQLLGHRDIRTTRGYTHVVDELLRDAAAKIGERLFGPVEKPKPKRRRA